MLVQRWVTPGAVGLVIATCGMSAVPRAASMAEAIAPLMMQCAHGYSGCMGVLSIGCQVASRSVASLPSISPLRIAVIGRQNAYLYLASMTAIAASASAAVITVMKRALSMTDISLRIAIWRDSGCVLSGPVRSQNRASSVCCGDRLLLFFAPSSLISL